MSTDNVRELNTTDFFDERLKEINSEMQGILDRTKKNRADLHAFPASEPFRAADTAAARPSEAAYCTGVVNDYGHDVPPPFGSASGVGSSEKWERAVSRMCQMEVSKWMDANLKLFLEPLIQAHVGQQVEVIQRGLQDLRFSHREVLASMSEVRRDVCDQRNSLTSVVQRLERQTNYVRQQLHDDMDQRTKDVKEALSSVEETVDTLRHLIQTEHQRGARRLEEALRRQQEQARWTLAQIEAQVYEWRDEISTRLRQHVDQLRDQHSSLEHHICRLQGIVDSTVEATNRQASDVRSLFEDAVVQRSELRVCHRDVNRLEMALQVLTGGKTVTVLSPSPHLQQESNNPKHHRSTNDQHHHHHPHKSADEGDRLAPLRSGLERDSPCRSPLTLIHEVLNLKERMTDLHQRVHAVEAGQDGFSHALDQERVERRNASIHAHSPALEVAMEHLNRSVEQVQRSMDGRGHSSATGVSSSATGLDGMPRLGGGAWGCRMPVPAATTMTTTRMAGLSGGLGDGFAGSKVGYERTSTPSPHAHLPQSVKSAGGGSGGGGGGGSPNGSSALILPSTVVSGYVAEENTPFHSGNSLRQKLSEGATRHSASSIPEYPKGEATVDDSYVSLTAGQDKQGNNSGTDRSATTQVSQSQSRYHNATGMQTVSSMRIEKQRGETDLKQSTTTNTTAKEETYAPPPTSDSESDRDNHHLTRLALD